MTGYDLKCAKEFVKNSIIKYPATCKAIHNVIEEYELLKKENEGLKVEIRKYDQKVKDYLFRS